MIQKTYGLFYLLWLTVPSTRPTFTLYNTKHFALSIFVKLNIFIFHEMILDWNYTGRNNGKIVIFAFIIYSLLQNSTIYIITIIWLYHILPFYIRIIPLLINYNIF